MFLQVEDLDSTVRGEGGFGSTGYHDNTVVGEKRPREVEEVKKLNLNGS